MESDAKNVIRVGSRKSELALIQTNFVIDSLKKLNPDKEFKIVSMTTLGDRILDVSLPKIGEKSLFTKDLEDSLRSNAVDFVVHSLKDLPTTLPDGLAIGAVFEREDPRDALVLRKDLKNHTLATLPAGSVIGTSSLRRTAQLHSRHPHLTVTDVRGNLNTRLRKLDQDGGYSALLLAAAGLSRMGWGDRIDQSVDVEETSQKRTDYCLVLPCSEMKYAVGQGALAVECVSDNVAVMNLLAPFNHPETYCRVLAERAFLKATGGGCSAPVGVSTKLKKIDSEYKLSITGAIWSLDGKTQLTHTLEKTFDQIRKPNKHKLSPTDDIDNKKPKTDDDIVNPVEELNKRISKRAAGVDLNCEDTRTPEEIADLKKEFIFCGMSENINVNLDVIKKCEQLGVDLANDLIAKGALELMKVTQDLIRNSTVAKKT